MVYSAVMKIMIKIELWRASLNGVVLYSTVKKIKVEKNTTTNFTL